MKKSEMIDKMVSIWFYGDEDKEHPVVVKSVRSRMEEVLSDLILSGMKPPLTKRCPVLLTNIHTWQKEE